MDSNNEIYGYSGKLLSIDLNKEKISPIPLNLKICEEFIGGAGYSCRYLIENIEQQNDGLDQNNILIIMTGPFTLSGIPASNRFVVCARSPYTGLWGEANCGGSFGPELKKAGYDGIIIKGKSKAPVLLFIENDKFELKDASKYWGQGTYYTSEKIKKDFDLLDGKVLCIGQAGENLVKYANINAEGRSAGRTGLGAVMGSKNLKAIIVRGKTHKINIFNPKEFKQSIKKAFSLILNSTVTRLLRDLGTSGGVLGAYSIGDLPIKYWKKGRWDDVVNISGEQMKKNYYVRNKACYGCPIGCGKIVEISDSLNKEKSIKCEGPEYETIAGFGSMILNSDLKSIIMANKSCNDFGMDTISTSSSIALLYTLYNEGKISKGDVDGLKLDWGDPVPALKLIRKIAYREGIGKILAEGSNYLGNFFKIEKENIATVNNLEIPYHDPRFCYSMAITYAFSPRGACHTTADTFKVLRSSIDVNYSSLGIRKMPTNLSNKKAVKSTIILQDYRSLYSSLIACFFFNPPVNVMCELINNLMGYNLDIDSIKLIGEKIFTIKRLFNIKMGLNSSRDNIPKIMLTPLKEGPIKGNVPNFEKMRKIYYKIRKWDPESGFPSYEKLTELGLNKIKI